MRIAVIRERDEAERRVPLTPDAVQRLVAAGHEVRVEAGLGDRAFFADDRYADAGAVVGPLSHIGEPDLIVSVTQSPAEALVGLDEPQNTAVVGLFDPLWRPGHMDAIARTGASVLALELVPRITKAQSMDVLSSMATIAGYEAVLLAARRLPKMFPLMMTAAGTVPPARVLVLGAGVAGLQAIATAKRLGAVVSGFDVRPAASEQIRSLGAKALEIETTVDAEGSGGYAQAQGDEQQARQRELLAPAVADSDVVITTAAIPGRRSPLLVTADMVGAMAPGSVVVDLAAERGGNCEITQADDEVNHGGVTVFGPTTLVSDAAEHASLMLSNNLIALIEHLTDDGSLTLDIDDEITAGMLVAAGGQIVHPMVLDAAGSSLEGSR